MKILYSLWLLLTAATISYSNKSVSVAKLADSANEPNKTEINGSVYLVKEQAQTDTGNALKIKKKGVEIRGYINKTTFYNGGNAGN